MSKSFLFITPLTPKRLLTPLRQMLFNEFINSLKAQSYANWKAILIGEEENIDGNIQYISCKAESKETKLIFAKEYILNLKIKPDYIIRIDDDDVINPEILNQTGKLDFDCYADLYHSFFDLVSGKISQQKRTWLANTVIHKYSHALAEVGEDKLPLMQADHSKDWIKYYSDKNLVYARKKEPVYLRVLSPTTVTSGTSSINSDYKNLSEVYDHFKSKAIEINSISDINFTDYNKYLNTFGKWKFVSINNFKTIQNRLELVWQKFSGLPLNNNIFIKFKKKWNSISL